MWWDARRGSLDRRGRAGLQGRHGRRATSRRRTRRAEDALRGDAPFVMQADGRGWLFAPTRRRRRTAPHPLRAARVSGRQPPLRPAGRTRRASGSAPDPTTPTTSPARRFPYVVTTYRLTEHHTAGAMSRTLPYLAELQPEMFCEVSPALAARARPRARRVGDDRHGAHGDRGARAGDRPDGPARGRGPAAAPGRAALPLGQRGISTGDSANDLFGLALDPNVHIQEVKAATCDVRPGAGRGSAGVRPAATAARASSRGSGSSPTRASASAARRARWRARNGTACPTSRSASPASPTTTRARWARTAGATWRSSSRSAIVDDGFRWLMSSDVCKHCTEAACLDACPTGALFRSEFGTVVVQEDVCNGCGYCVVACPFGVIDRRERDGRAFKCTMCYDRLKDGDGAGLREGVPHRVDPVRPPGRAARARGRGARARAAGARRERRTALRSRPRRRRRRRGRLLPAARRAGGVRAAARPGGADPAIWAPCGRRPGSRRERWPPAWRHRLPEAGDEPGARDARWSRARNRAPTTAGRWSSRRSGVPRCRGTSSPAGSRAARPRSRWPLSGAATSGWPGARAWSRCAPGRRARVLLISDLGRPARFLNMLRVFKPTSPDERGLVAARGRGDQQRRSPRRLEGVRAVRARRASRRGSRRGSPVRP